MVVEASESRVAPVGHKIEELSPANDPSHDENPNELILYVADVVEISV